MHASPTVPAPHRRPHRCLLAVLLVTACAALLGCGGDDTLATVALFDVEADLTNPEQFFQRPFPSDLRLTAKGQPDLAGFPNPENNDVVAGLLTVAADRPGWPVIPTAYFRFSAPLRQLDSSDVVMPAAGAPYLLIDLDEPSSAYPTVALTLTKDNYVPENLIAVAAAPGFVLHPNRRYAFILTRAMLDSRGLPVAADSAFAHLRDGFAPQSPAEQALADALTPLWPALDSQGVARANTIAATVFTTGDVVADLAAMGDKVRAKHTVTIDDLKVDPDDGATHARFCELIGSVSFPQFQQGTPPFDEQGLFDIAADVLPRVHPAERDYIDITLQ